MFDDSFFVTLALVAFVIVLSGPAALLVALIQRGRLVELETKLAKLQRLMATPPAAQPAPATPPLPEKTEPAPVATEPTAPPLKPASVPKVAATPPQAAAAKPKPSFEERFGTRWTVWIGGVALAFGAVLLVRYSIESGFFGPGMRILSGFALSFALLGTGEALRRRLRGAAPVPARWPDVPATVTAAGIVSLFGVIYASYALYGFVGPELAFVGLGATGLVAMLAALLHGPALAGIGLVGALATPLLIGGSGSIWPLTLYLPIVAATAYAFAWIKGWRALAVAGGIGAAAWTILLAMHAAPESAAASLVHAVLQAALASGVFAILPHRGGTDEKARPDRFAVGALAAASLAMVAALAMLSTPLSGASWIAAAFAAVAIPAVAAFLAPAAAAGLGIAGLVLAAVIVVWPPQILPDLTGLPFWSETRDPGTMLTLVAIAALGIAAAGALRLLGGARLPTVTAYFYAGAAALTPLAALGLTYLRITEGAPSSPFAAGAAALALAMTITAAFFRRQAERTPDARLTLGLGAFASAAVASLALGLVFAISGGSLTVAMALAALGTAAIAQKLDIKALRWCVAGLGLVVAARLAWDPTVVGPDLSTTPIFNGLLLGYGIPALAFGLSAWLIRLPDERKDTPVLVAEALSLILAALLVFFEIRHATHHGDILADGTTALEQGLVSFAALCFAIVLVRLEEAAASPVFRIASLIFGALAVVQSVLGLALVANPLFTDDPVFGGVLVNEILLAYGFPAIAALVLAQSARGKRPEWYVRIMVVLGVVLGVLGVTLMIRHGFQGERIGIDRPTSDGEWYGYSAGWLILGILFLVYGALRHSMTARLASAALVVLTTAKVFLFDLAGLDGPLRALSFLGLGVTLIGIGLFYQRFVFGPKRETT